MVIRVIRTLRIGLHLEIADSRLEKPRFVPKFGAADAGCSQSRSLRTDSAPAVLAPRQAILMSQILRCVSSLLVCFALGVSISHSRADDSSSPAATNPADESAADRDLFRLIPASSNSGDGARSFTAGYDLGNGQCLGDPCQVNTKFGADPYCRLFPQDRLFQFRGWLDAGILGNAASPSSHFNGPYNSQEVDNGQFNQAYLIMERVLASDGLFSFGGRIDLLYGADYFLAQSTGLEKNPDGTPALEQQSVLRSGAPAGLCRVWH